MEYLHKNQDKILALSVFMEKLLKMPKERKKMWVENHKELINSIKPLDLFYLDMYKQDTSSSIEEIKASANQFVNLFYLPLKDMILENHSSAFFKCFNRRKRSHN